MKKKSGKTGDATIRIYTESVEELASRVAKARDNKDLKGDLSIRVLERAHELSDFIYDRASKRKAG